ncbi:MAG: rod shape-determining protein [Clostridia bacterium]|nr:rod shape-determining protein [Clostridia bacterium]
MYSNEIVVDIGYSKTVIAVRGKGIIFNEPSVVAVTKSRGKLKLIASGLDAKRHMKSRDRSHGTTLVHPVKEGVIENAEAAVLMLKDFLKKALPHRSFLSPKLEVIAVISCGISVVERKNYENVLSAAGLKSPILMETPIAISALLSSDYNLIVNCGASIADIAIVGPTGIITGCSVTTCGIEADRKICAYIADNYRMGISSVHAEELRIKIGSFYDNRLVDAQVSGKNLVDNTPHQAEITANEIFPMLSDVALNLADVVESVSMMCPEKLIMDVYHAGITFTGGFANSYGLSDFLAERLKMAVNVPKSPETTPALGALAFFDDREKMYKML